MAKATSNVKRVSIQGDITLTLTPLEAIFLRAIVACNAGDENDSNDPEFYAYAIYRALENANVPAVDIESFAKNGEIKLLPSAYHQMENALRRW